MTTRDATFAFFALLVALGAIAGGLVTQDVVFALAGGVALALLGVTWSRGRKQ